MDAEGVEGEADELHRKARSDPCDPALVRTVATRLLGPPVRVQGQFAAAALVPRGLGRPPAIHLQAGLSGPAAAWHTAHELGEWWIDEHPRRFPVEDRERERAANRLAGAILVPGPALRDWLRKRPFDPALMCARFQTTPRILAQRLAEARGWTVALVGELEPYRAGEGRLPPEEVLRSWVARGPPDGVRVLHLTGRWRVSLVVFDG